MLIRFQQTTTGSVGVPGPAIPKTLREFQWKFATEEACQKYLAASRWLEGFACPRCGNHRRQCSVLSAPGLTHRWNDPGQYEDSAGSLVLGRYLMTRDKRGGLSLLSQRQLSMRRYETVFMMLSKIPCHGQLRP